MFKKIISVLLILSALTVSALPIFAAAETATAPTTETVYSQDFNSGTIADAGLVDIGKSSPTTAIENGKLVITAGSSDAWVGLPETIPTNMQSFTLTFDMFNISLPASGYHNGMAYRFTDTANFARTTMRANGAALINTKVNDSFKGCADASSVVEKNLAEELEIDTANGNIPLNITYKFKIVVKPDDVSVFINDLPATRRHGSDNYFSEGSFGFYVSKDCSVAFDNISITQTVYNYKNGDVVYSEDFTDETASDLSISGTGASLAVTDGCLTVSAGTSDAWVTLPESFDTSMEKFIFEVEMTNISLPETGFHNGIVYRYAGAGDFERATLRASGIAIMHVKQNNAWVTKNGGVEKDISKKLELANIVDGENGKVMDKEITYKLRVEVGKDETVFYVNGIYADTRKTSDSRMSSGKLGFYVSKNCTVAFDNVKVTYGDTDFELGVVDGTGNSSPESENGNPITEDKQSFTQNLPTAEEYIEQTPPAEEGGCPFWNWIFGIFKLIFGKGETNE